MADGTYVFYAHMTGIADGIAAGVPVKAGQIVGTVGSTGNSGTPHLHFEVHPKGGAAVNPYPIVKAINGCSNTPAPPALIRRRPAATAESLIVGVTSPGRVVFARRLRSGGYRLGVRCTR